MRLIVILMLLVSPLAAAGKHLFILSGQSNMHGLQPDKTFIPAVERRFGKENVIVVFDALGGAPIRRWYRDWKPADGRPAEGNGDLYERLMKKVGEATKDREIESVTFLWMQGERDAREGHGGVYEASLRGLVRQLSEDLGRKDVNVVIGRLSDFGNDESGYRDWKMIREVQIKVAESLPSGAWVDTDDLNDGLSRNGKQIRNDLHYSKQGYLDFGTRLAAAAIRLIEQAGKK